MGWPDKTITKDKSLRHSDSADGCPVTLLVQQCFTRHKGGNLGLGWRHESSHSSTVAASMAAELEN